MKQGIVVWLTGLSGAGKSTIADLFRRQREEMGFTVRIVDGDDVRDMRKVKLSFSPEDIRENNRMIAEFVASVRSDYDYVLVSVVAPFSASRELSRRIIGGKYFECYVNAGIETVVARDTKGLYRKALNGEVEFVIGVDPRVPYEKPSSPDVEVRTEIRDPAVSVRLLTEFLDKKQ
jgi:adenylyl-sulfate kinase